MTEYNPFDFGEIERSLEPSAAARIRKLFGPSNEEAATNIKKTLIRGYGEKEAKRVAELLLKSFKKKGPKQKEESLEHRILELGRHYRVYGTPNPVAPFMSKEQRLKEKIAPAKIIDAIFKELMKRPYIVGEQVDVDFRNKGERPNEAAVKKRIRNILIDKKILDHEEIKAVTRGPQAPSKQTI